MLLFEKYGCIFFSLCVCARACVRKGERSKERERKRENVQTGAFKHFLTQFRLQSEIMRPCVVTKKYAKEKYINSISDVCYI